MSDIENIAFVSAKITAMRGLMSGSTYQRLKDSLNTIQGEVVGMKSRIGTLESDVELLRGEVLAERAKSAALEEELAGKSIQTVDKAVEKIVEAAEASVSAEQVISAIEANSVPDVDGTPIQG